jgi:hypothetical protein
MLNTDRRLVLCGLGVTLIGAPAIVRASSLMPVPRMLFLAPPVEAIRARPQEGLVRRLLMQSCVSHLNRGYDPQRAVRVNGRGMTEQEMRNMAAYAYRWGFLSPADVQLIEADSRRFLPQDAAQLAS